MRTGIRFLVKIKGADNVCEDQIPYVAFAFAFTIIGEAKSLGLLLELGPINGVFCVEAVHTHKCALPYLQPTMSRSLQTRAVAILTKYYAWRSCRQEALEIFRWLVRLHVPTDENKRCIPIWTARP